MKTASYGVPLGTVNRWPKMCTPGSQAQPLFMYNLYTICSAALVSGIRKISSNNLRNVQYVNTVQCNFFRKKCTFPQTSHRIKDSLQRYLIPWLRPFTVSFLYKDPPSPPPPPNSQINSLVSVHHKACHILVFQLAQ